MAGAQTRRGRSRRVCPRRGGWLAPCRRGNMETIPSRRTPLERPGYPWKIFWLLLVASILGVAAVLPFVFALFRKMISTGPLPMPLPVLIAVQLMESAILFAALISLGLLLARAVGIEKIGRAHV